MSCRELAGTVRRRLDKILKLSVIVGVVFVSSYCTQDEKQTENQSLTEDEVYLVETYVKIADARDLYSANPLKSESLFAVLDSTTDSLRIAETIRELNMNPDRWPLIFRSIERAGDARSQGQDSE